MAKRAADDPGRLIHEVIRTLTIAPAYTRPSLRRAIVARSGASAGVAPPGPDEIPAELLDFVDKIAERATEVTDEDFATLSARGYTVDQLFDVVLAASLGASHARLERGLGALALALEQLAKEP